MSDGVMSILQYMVDLWYSTWKFWYITWEMYVGVVVNTLATQFSGSGPTRRGRGDSCYLPATSHDVNYSIC